MKGPPRLTDLMDETPRRPAGPHRRAVHALLYGIYITIAHFIRYTSTSLCLCVCVCVRVREKERESSIDFISAPLIFYY